jgi:uncharacterized protein YcbK (DUF882 family)
MAVGGFKRNRGMIYANQDPRKATVYALSERGRSMSLTTRVTLGEFASKDRADIVKVHPAIIKLLEQLEQRFPGKKIIIRSGYRSPAHNKAVGGAPASKHMNGTAVDVVVEGVSVEDLARTAEAWGVGGVGRYPRSGFVHLDVEGQNRRWTL